MLVQPIIACCVVSALAAYATPNSWVQHIYLDWHQAVDQGGGYYNKSFDIKDFFIKTKSLNLDSHILSFSV